MLDLEFAWQVVYWGVFLQAFVLFPWAIFFYEAYDVDENDEENGILQRACSATAMMLCSLVVAVALILVAFFALNKSDIPYDDLTWEVTAPKAFLTTVDSNGRITSTGTVCSAADAAAAKCVSVQSSTLTLDITFTVL